MAKPLGPKSLLIREAVRAHPDMGNTELAELINSSDARQEDKIKVKPGDIAAQKQAMKKAGETIPAPTARGASRPARKGGNGRRTPGRKAKAERTATRVAAAQPSPRAAAQAGPVDLIDKTLDLAQQCGGVAALKRLVDRLAEVQRA
jgi:hypothetical protein